MPGPRRRDGTRGKEGTSGADDGSPGEGQGNGWGRFRPGRDSLLLALVALGYGLAQIGSWRLDLGWDETIYVSQVDPQTPAAFFSAPRARGITFLAAPVTRFTSDVTLLRVWFTLLATLALFVAFRIWFAVIAPLAAVIAALVFGSLWVSVFYGPQVMPNLWVAFSAVAATGALLRVLADPRDRTGRVMLPVSLAVMALMRPSDAGLVAAPLVLGVLLLRTWRTRAVLLGTFGGLAVGAMPWLVESFVRFGGPLARLRQAGEIQGGTGFNPRLIGRTVQTLNGPLLCRPCHPQPVSQAETWWFFLVPVAVIAGLLVARRAGRLRTALLPTLCAASIGVPYLLLLTYTAPRFLLPSYALAALPTGIAIHQVLVRAGRWRLPAIAGVLVLLGLHVAVQAEVVHHRQQVAQRNGNGYAAVAEALHSLGAVPPDCVVSGLRAAPIAFYARCSSRMVGGHDGSITASGLLELSTRHRVLIVVRGRDDPPAYAQHWEHHPLPRLGRLHLRAYLSPKPLSS